MRFALSVTALAVLSFVVPTSAFAQLSVTNYRLIREERVNSTQSFYILAADLVNTGGARSVVTATVTSPVANLQTVPGAQNLHFSPVPAGSQVPSLDTFRLLVNTSGPIDYRQLQWTFNAPFANAGPNQTVPVGQTVLLNGSGSSNPAGGGYLNHNWTFLSRPAGSSARILNSWDVMGNFVADVTGGVWIVQLTVSNSAGSDVAVMTVTTGNSPPVANAGPNQTVAAGAQVTLNGSASSDVDGDSLIFSWTLTTRPVGSNAALSNSSSVMPTFIADRNGVYVARLTVNDGKGNNSAPANVTIATQNTAPVANAGSAQSVNVGALVQLSGAGSTDVDGNPLTYAWSLTTKPSGSAANLSSGSSVNPTFTVDLPGTYVAQLIVNDGQVSSLPATVSITTTGSLAPTANAGPNQTVRHSSTVQLNGSGTDPQSRSLTYLWSLTTRPPNSNAALSSLTSRTPTFRADLVGNYVAQLIVNNGVENSLPSTVTITTTNTAPVANAGINQTAAINSVVALNGSFSSDADGDAITYAWSFSSRPAGSTASLQAATSASPTFVPDLAGTYVVQLIVSDVLTASVPATVTITAGANTLTLSPDPLTFQGGSATMTLTLSAAAGPSGQVVNLNSIAPSVATVPVTVFVAPNATMATFQVTAAGNGSSTITATAPQFRPGSATVNVGIPAIAIALSNATVGLTRSISGTVTLSSAAPTGGTTVTVSAAPFGIVTLSDVPVVIQSGAISGTFSLTGLAVGTANISGTAPGYTGGSASVNSSLLGQIAVERNITVAPGANRPIAVSLASAAPTGGVIITLVSSSPSNVAVSNTVTIAAGSTVPAIPATVTGFSFGSATITATAGGFTGDSALVVTGSALSFTPSVLNLSAGAQQSLTLALSDPAPSNLTVNLLSSNPQAATVPAAVTILQNATSVSVPVTGVSSGSAIITATPAIPNVLAATANVTVSNLGSVQMPPSTTLTLGQTVPVQVTLSSVAPSGGATVNLTSSSSSVTLSSSSVFIPAGSATPSVQPTMTGAGPGSSTITAAATGFNSATQTVNVTASFTLSPATISFPSGSSQNLSLTVSGPAPPGGLTVNLSSSNGANASVPSTVVIGPGATSVQVPVAGLVPGTSVITASAAGITSGSATVTITNSGLILVSNVTVSPGQSAPLLVTLPVPASFNTTIALASSDPARATLSQSTVTIFTGQTQATVPPSVNGVSFGSATITATANGFGPGSGNVTVGAALSFSQSSLTLTAGAAQSLQLSLSVVAPTGGVPVTFTYSNGAVLQGPFGTNIAQNSGGVNFQVTGLTPGTTTITASTSVPNVTPATITITVPGAGGGNGTIALPVGASVNVGQSVAYPLTLSTAAGPGGVIVSLASSDPARVTISPATVTVLAGQTQPPAQPQITGVGAGSANITATAPNFNNATQAVQVNASGNIALSPATLNVTVGSTQNLTVTLPVAAAFGGRLVSLGSSDASVASVPVSVTVPQGVSTATFAVTGNAAGATTITASSSGQGQASSAITVAAAGTINLPANFLVGPGQTRPFPVTLATAAASATTVTLSSGDSSRLTISPPTIFFAAGQMTPTSQPNVTGVAEGIVTVSASGSALTAAAANVRVGYTLSFAPNTVAITGTGTQNLNLTLSSVTPTNLTVNLSSATPGVARVNSTVVFSAGSTSANVPVTGVAPGTAIITAVAANIPSTTGTATVTAPNIISVPALSTVSLGKFVAFPINLPSPAGMFGVTVTITSADDMKVIVPPSIFIGPGLSTATAQLLGENVGDVNITASAPGYLPGVGLVKVGTTATWQLRSMELAPGQSRVAFLDLGASAPGQPPFPGDTGVRINFTSSNPAVATMRDFVTAYPDGSEFTIIAVVINAQAPGTAIISSSGINIPVDQMTITVGGPLTINTNSLPNGTVGTPYAQTLQGAGGTAPRSWSLIAGTLPGGLSLNTASGLISGTPTTAVAATPLTFRLTDNSVPTPQSLTVQLTLTIGVGSGGGASMTLTPSPLAITGTATQNLTLALSVPAPLSGLVVNLSSSSSSVATVGSSSITVPAGSINALIPVTGVSAGGTLVTALANGYGQTTANVTVSAVSAGDIILPQAVVVAPGDFQAFPLTLAAPAAQATFVTLTINDPSRASFSQESVFFNAGRTTPILQPRLNGIAAGPIVITASAFGLATSTANALIGFSLTFTPATVNITGTGTQNVTLSLSSSTGNNLVATLTSSDPNVATVPATVTFAPGSTTANVAVTGVTPGTTVLTAMAAGIPNATANVTVMAPGAINIPAVTLPLGQTLPLPISITSPAPIGGLTIALVNSQPGRVTMPASVTIPAGQTTPASPVILTGVNVGPSTITATAPAYVTGTGVVNVNATVSWQTTNPFVNQGAQQTLLLRLSASAPVGGVSLALTSSDPAVVQVQPSISLFPDGTEFTTVQINVTGLTAGTAIITAEGLNIPAASVTVTVVGPLSIQTSTLTAGSVGIAYSQPLMATGGSSPYTWALTNGVLPGGLSLDPATGVISGTPDAAVAARELTFQVSDGSTPPQTASGVVLLTITAQQPVSIAVNLGGTQSAAVGSAFGTSLSVLVKDGNDLPIPGLTVAFAVPATGASAAFSGGNTAETNASGIATANILNANSSLGSYAVIASVSGLVPTATFSLTNVPGPAASVSATSGTPQNTARSTAFGSPLRATVRDIGGNALSGVVVTFVLPGSAANATFAGGVNTATTDNLGVATSAALTANATVGSYAITASAPNAATQATFNLTNTSGAVTSIAVNAGANQSASTSAAFLLPLRAIVRDAGNSPVPGVLVTFTVPASGASATFAGGVNSATTDASGIAVSPVITANATVGSYTVVATAAGVNNVQANFALTNASQPPTSVIASTGTPQAATAGTTFAQRLVALVRDANGNGVGGRTVTFTVPVAGAGGTFSGGVNTAVTDGSGFATSAQFTANGIAGVYQVMATTAALPPAVFNLTNNAVVMNGPQILIPNVQVGKNLQVLITVTIPQAAPPGGQRIVLTPTDYSLIRVAGRQADAGIEAPLTVTIGEGLTQVTGIFVQGLESIGTAQIIATSAGYTDGIATVDLFPSGFVLSGPNGSGGSFNMFQGASAQLNVQSARLTQASAFAEVQAVKGGVALIFDSQTGRFTPGPNTSVGIALSSSTTSVGDVAPSTVTIVGGQLSASANFLATNIGVSTVTAAAPAGYTLPVGGSNVLAVTVVPSGLVAPNASVGQNLQVATRFTLNSPAPNSGCFVTNSGIICGLPVTVTSSDSSRVRFSPGGSSSPEDIGLATITVVVPVGRTTSQDFFVQGFQSSGSVPYTLTGPGFGNSSAVVSLFPSGFVLTSPFGRGANFITTSGAQNSDISVTAARLDGAGNFLDAQSVRGGLIVNVAVFSGSPNIGTITSSPITIAGPGTSGSTQFDPSSNGTTLIVAVAPAGFATPSAASLNAQVLTPQLNVSAVTVGRNLQTTSTLLLGQPAPAGGVNVTLTSGSPQVLLSSGPNTPGTPTTVINVPAGQSAAFFFIQGFASSGTANYSVQAPNYTSTSGTVTLAPSGIVISSIFGVGAGFATTVGGGNQAMTISTALLDASNVFQSTQPLAAGLTQAVSLSNTTPAAGSFPLTATITGGNSDVNVNFSPATVANTTLGVVNPSGYSLPTTGTTVLVQVKP